MDLAVSILTSLVSSAVFVAALAFGVKLWVAGRIQHEFDCKLETMRGELRSRNDVELERLRSRLELAAIEHNVRFTKQYDVMASVIAEVYRQTSELYSAVANYISPIETDAHGPRSDRRERVNELLREFGEFFYVKRIYLSRDTADRVENFRNRLYDVSQKFAINVDAPSEQCGDWDASVWSQTWDALTKEVKPLRAELEDEFRDLLGVRIPPAKMD